MRNKRLDILRCVAVLLVIIHHREIIPFFTKAGWVGVDLFFVLSGFLISGLLFGEYKKRQSIDVPRFFIRRGLKIYPSFYVFLVLTLLASIHRQDYVGTRTQYLHEIFFLQNYTHPVWGHTWSLAVEEHFYIFLALFLFILVRATYQSADPFRIIPSASIVIALACMAFRAGLVCSAKPKFLLAYFATHARMDALFFGVLLGYLSHFHPARLENLLRPTRNRIAIALISPIFLSMAYFLPRETKMFSIFGFTMVYLGCGGILLLSLYVRNVLPDVIRRPMGRIGSAFAFVGMYSYSIYLWHLPVNLWTWGRVVPIVHITLTPNQGFVFYLVTSLIVGVMISRLIEYPVLRLRDRLFPAAQTMIGPLATVAVTSRREPSPTPLLLPRI
jgi:peptidoglycan/LPS O-acetylase OafA/YrhL